MSSVLITGITTGIGRNLLVRYLRENHSVTGVIRADAQRELFKDMPPDRLTLHVADLADIEQTSRLIDELCPQIFDTIILNAGMTYSGHFLDLPRDHIDEIIRTNLLSNMHIIRGLIEGADRNDTKIVFISSLAARLPAFNSGVYAASKAGLSHFYNSLSFEYPRMRMLCVEIGLVDTPFFEKSGAPAGKRNSFFKSPDFIAERLMREIKSKTGITSLCLDWTIMRKIFMMCESLTVWIISHVRILYHSR